MGFIVKIISFCVVFGLRQKWCWRKKEKETFQSDIEEDESEAEHKKKPTASFPQQEILLSRFLSDKITMCQTMFWGQTNDIT